MVVTKLGFDFYIHFIVLTGYIVSIMVTIDVNKRTTICLPITGNLFDRIFVAATDNYLRYCPIKV